MELRPTSFRVSDADTVRVAMKVDDLPLRIASGLNWCPN